MFANVIIQYGNKAVDREFTYIVPNCFREQIKIGHRVRVLFNNRETNEDKEERARPSIDALVNFPQQSLGEHALLSKEIKSF